MTYDAIICILIFMELTLDNSDGLIASYHRPIEGFIGKAIPNHHFIYVGLLKSLYNSCDKTGQGTKKKLIMLMISKVFIIKYKNKQMKLPRQHLYLIISLTLYFLPLIIYKRKEVQQGKYIFFHLKARVEQLRYARKRIREISGKGVQFNFYLHIYLYFYKRERTFSFYYHICPNFSPSKLYDSKIL